MSTSVHRVAMSLVWPWPFIFRSLAAD